MEMANLFIELLCQGAIKENISKEEAEEIKAKLEEAGASVELA